MASHGVIDEIKSRLDVVEVVSQYVQLKKAGRTYKGLCPFHSEKTPSFIVFPSSESFHCFGCGASGDILGFVMKAEKLEFREALQRLAARAGVELEPASPQAAKEKEHITRLSELNVAAALYYHHILLRSPAGEPGREYATKRGLSTETQQLFRLGYAPEGWNGLENYLLGKGFERQELIDAGVTIEREGGGQHDRFRNRFMFPICDRGGRILGFGGRALDDRPPKYLNTPETPLFDKGSCLYAIDEAHQAISRLDEAIMVEGYIDVLIAHQGGIKNVVATMGTALGERQVALLNKLTKNLVLALDADSAGEMATLRGIEVMRQSLNKRSVPVVGPSGVHIERKVDAVIRIATLPKGRDPDEVIRENPEVWKRLISQAMTVPDHAIETFTRGVDRNSARDKARAIEQLAPIITEIGNPVEQAHYVQRLGNLLQIDDASIRSAISRGPGPARRQQVREPQGVRTRHRTTTPEDHLLALLLKYPHAVLEAMGNEFVVMLGAEYNAILAAVPEAGGPDGMLDVERLKQGVDVVLHDQVDTLVKMAQVERDLSESEIEEEVQNRLARIERQALKRRIQQYEYLLRDAQEAGDGASVDVFQKKVSEAMDHLRGYERPRRSPYFRDLRDSF